MMQYQLNCTNAVVHNMCHKGSIPQENNDAPIIRFYKKGTKVKCDNQLGIFVLVTEGLIGNVGLGRGLVQQTWYLLLISHTRNARKRTLISALPFVDLTKAFDTVSREGLRKKIGYAGKFIDMMVRLSKQHSISQCSD